MNMTQPLIELIGYLVILCGTIAALVTLIATKWTSNDQ